MMKLFPKCKKAEILDPKSSIPTTASVSTGSVSGLLVTVPLNAELSLRGPVDIRFYDPTLGVVRCRCRLFSPVTAGGMRTYRCEVLEQLSQIQRREDIKIPLNIPVTTDYLGMLYSSSIENISAGGVYLVSALTAPVGDRLSFLFPKTVPSIPLTAKILRADPRVAPNGRTTFGYGCRFVGLNLTQESLLRSFIFQEERRLRSQGRQEDE